MRGEPGHCFAAQVWDNDGLSIAYVGSRYGEKTATEIVKILAAAPDLLNALIKVVEHAKEFGLSYDVYDQAEKAIEKALGTEA